MTQRNVIVSLGANLPRGSDDPRATLEAALRHLDCADLRLRRVSRFYLTPAVPAGSGPDFVNAAALLVSDLPPERILDRLHATEARFGRERRSRWAARVIDLDLIAVGALVRPDAAGHALWRRLPPSEQARRAPDALILPHPRLQDRAFVLVPLCDVAPDWRHPILGASARELRDALDPAEVGGIVVLPAPGSG